MSWTCGVGAPPPGFSEALFVGRVAVNLLRALELFGKALRQVLGAGVWGLVRPHTYLGFSASRKEPVTLTRVYSYPAPRRFGKSPSARVVWCSRGRLRGVSRRLASRRPLSGEAMAVGAAFLWLCQSSTSASSSLACVLRNSSLNLGLSVC